MRSQRGAQRRSATSRTGCEATVLRSWQTQQGERLRQLAYRGASVFLPAGVLTLYVLKDTDQDAVAHSHDEWS